MDFDNNNNNTPGPSAQMIWEITVLSDIPAGLLNTVV